MTLPVIMLSARKQERDVVGGLAEGANDYLVKPFMPEELAVRIQKVLRVPA
jgi:DNA-binding response OmpR family regulator